jgi:hypothetical protein
LHDGDNTSAKMYLRMLSSQRSKATLPPQA